MRRSVRLGLGIAVSLLAACQTQQQFLDQNQAEALQVATNRGRFEMGCPAVEPTLLSREMTQPAIEGPYVAGIERGEYTIGVSGCDQRKTYVVICPEGGDGCFAAEGRRLGE